MSLNLKSGCRNRTRTYDPLISRQTTTQTSVDERSPQVQNCNELFSEDFKPTEKASPKSSPITLHRLQYGGQKVLPSGESVPVYRVMVAKIKCIFGKRVEEVEVGRIWGMGRSFRAVAYTGKKGHRPEKGFGCRRAAESWVTDEVSA